MKKISLAKLEGFLKARCDDLRAAGLDATEYRDYIIAMIFLKRVNDTFEKEQRAYVKKLKKEYPDCSDEELAQEAEENNSDVYEFYVPVEARWKVSALPVALHSEMSQRYSEAKGKLEGRLSEVERMRYQQQFDEAERMLNWHGIIEEKADVGAVITRALKAIEDSNGHFLSGVLSEIKFDEVDGKGERKLPDEILTSLVNEFNGIVLTDENFEFPDLLGAAYEYLLKYFAEDAGKKGGEFYTPAPVVELMGRILQPAKDAEICDPTVGSGGLLINMRNYVESRYGTARELTLYGQELSPHTYKMCKMNMIFHGIKEARIERQDTLVHPKLVNEGKLCLFDIVVANPPFSQNYTTAEMEFKERFRYFMPKKKKADFMFVQHMVATLKSDGRMAVVMPHGVLFRGGDEEQYRKELISGENGCILECVIGLPEGLFYGTGIPASILVVNKAGAKDRPGVLFINADREFAEGKKQNSLRPEDVEKISFVYTHKTELPKYSRLVKKEDLAAEDYNCNIRRYVDNAPDAEPQDVLAHMVGGIPVAEINSLDAKFVPWGDVRKSLFTSAKNGYSRFVNTVDSKDKIASVIRSDRGVLASLSDYAELVDAFWKKVESQLKALPEKKDVFALCEQLAKKFSAVFGERTNPILDEFQSRGAFARYLADLKSDFKSVAASAWNAELIPDDEILESQFPEVLKNLRDLEARKAELQAKFDAVAEFGEDDEWNPEENEAMPKPVIKQIKAEIKEAKSERNLINKRLKEVAKRKKAYAKAHEDVPAELLAEETEKAAALVPFDEKIAALEAQIARHVALEEELKTCTHDIRVIERRRDDLVDQAREKISPDEARKLILLRWHRTLADTVSAYLELRLRDIIAAVENLYCKYTVTLGDILGEREAAAAKLDSFLEELGYTGAHAR